MTKAALWLPTLYTQPLTEDFESDGDKLLQVIDLAWKSPDDDDFSLDEWQRWLIKHVLERYPADHPKYPGELRYRQVVISMGRQNGKTVLGAVFGLYGLLLHCQGPTVVGIAGDKEQADNLFKKVKFVVDYNPTLTKRYKSTNTRGLYSRNPQTPASYVVKAGAEKGLQGFTISLALADELHLWKDEPWNAITFGASRKESIIIGITTAGDDKSKLLKRLYKTGKAAAVGEEESDERFGFFLWEAPDHLDVTDPDAIIAANPAYACGREDVDEAIRKIKNMPENQARRYRLNQFVASESSWLPMNLWNRLEKGGIPEEAMNKPGVFGVERSENWQYASIVRAVKYNGKVYTETVASVTNPTLESLENMCIDLNTKFAGSTWMMEVTNLRDLAMRLRERGVKVEYLTSNQMNNACATAYSLISEEKVVHANDELLRKQMPKAVAKNYGEGWRISRRDSSGEVDTVIATVIAVYGAEIIKESGPMLFVA